MCLTSFNFRPEFYFSKLTVFNGTSRPFKIDYTLPSIGVVAKVLQTYKLDICNPNQIADIELGKNREVRETTFLLTNDLVFLKKDYHKGNPLRPDKTTFAVY